MVDGAHLMVSGLEADRGNAMMFTMRDDPLMEEVSGYAPEARRRLLVRPGMTGPVADFRPFRSRLGGDHRLVLYYVETWSIVGDLLILWKTIRAVRSSSGAC